MESSPRPVVVHPSLSDHANAGLPLLVPWMRQEIKLGTVLDSSLLQSEKPWLSSSPFDLRGNEDWLAYEGETEGRANYREANSDSHESTTDHFSGSLGVTVGCSFLNANVTGKYDQTVNYNADSHKVSRVASCHTGTIRFAREPPLAPEARQMLCRPDGAEQFRRMYGDYYVASYTLGGEAGAFISVDTDARTEVDKAAITISVKVLFFKKSHTEEKVSTSHVEHLKYTFSGYDTLDGKSESSRPDPRPLAQLQEACSVYLDKSNELGDRVSQTLRSLGLKKGHNLPMTECGRICRSGLVVQLLLVPFTWLRGYQTAIAKAPRFRENMESLGMGN